MTLTEAAACGTPAVATRIPGHVDAVAEGVSGLLADDRRWRRRHHRRHRHRRCPPRPARRRRARTRPAVHLGRHRHPDPGGPGRGSGRPPSTLGPPARPLGLSTTAATSAGHSETTRSDAAPERPGRIRRRFRPGWWRRPGPYVGLAVLAWLPLFRNKRGKIGADTKCYLYLDPGRLLKTGAVHVGPQRGHGHRHPPEHRLPVADGPVLLAHGAGRHARLGGPAALARVILFPAGAGVRYLLRTLAWKGAGVVTAAMCSTCSAPTCSTSPPASRSSCCPAAGLPWMVGVHRPIDPPRRLAGSGAVRPDRASGRQRQRHRPRRWRAWPPCCGSPTPCG